MVTVLMCSLLGLLMVFLLQVLVEDRRLFWKVGALVVGAVVLVCLVSILTHRMVIVLS